MAVPTAAPTAAPTFASLMPTPVPTAAPTFATPPPTPVPSFAPSFAPTAAPSPTPTAAPALAPTSAPSAMPTSAPTLSSPPTVPDSIDLEVSLTRTNVGCASYGPKAAFYEQAIADVLDIAVARIPSSSCADASTPAQRRRAAAARRLDDAAASVLSFAIDFPVAPSGTTSAEAAAAATEASLADAVGDGTFSARLEQRAAEQGVAVEAPEISSVAAAVSKTPAPTPKPSTAFPTANDCFCLPAAPTKSRIDEGCTQICRI
ncbi:hypothetical protein M885DRAFT_542731 [Pelagophyceae sp. CCMP2097]|nr:hypothetical protein M885DRAFT_542731 [Pelagophyceae sp. CCMP2097]